MKRVIGKPDLIARAANKSGLSKKDVECVLDALTESITEIVKEGDTVQLVGFGRFYPALQKGRMGTVPGTTRTYKTSDKTVPKFEAGKAFKQALL
jgi:DNA-binding protein HU-beta